MKETNEKASPDLMDKNLNRWGFRIIVFLVFGFVLALLGFLGWGLVRAQRGQVQSGQAPDFTLTTFDNQQASLKIYAVKLW